MSKRWLAAALSAILLPSSQTPLPTAGQRLTHLREQAATLAKSSDHQARLAVILEIRKFLNNSPRYIESAAAAYAVVGDTNQALAALEEFAAMGQADDALLPGKDPRLAPLQNLPRYQAVLKRMAANSVPLTRSETAFTLSDANLQPEDIDYDATTATFLITSVREKKIIRVTKSGTATDFARSPSNWPMMAIKIDTTHKLVWATEAALNGFASVPKADWGRSAVLSFDLASGTLRQRIEAPNTALGDLTLTPHGEPIVSDGENGGVYRIRNNKLEPINQTDFISPQTPVVLPDGNRALVPDYLRGIALLDLTTGQVLWLDSAKTALSGVDGLYLPGTTLLLTQNGTTPERVLRVRLDPTLTKVVSEDTIERATPTLGDPTHGVLVGNQFYYIANSGWDKVGDDGESQTGQTLTPARLMRYRLR